MENKTVSTVGILPVEKVQELEKHRKKIRFWWYSYLVSFLLNGGLLAADLIWHIPPHKVSMGLSCRILAICIFSIIRCIWLGSTLEERKAEIKQEYTQKYLEKHPELLDIAKEKSIIEQANKKANDTICNLIDINGNVDENAILEALQK